FEKMESVLSISNCPATSQVKFMTCTLQDVALTWWNAHVKTTTTEVAHAMPWAALKKMMTDKYCPRGEIKKIETEMMFPKEVDKIEKYIGGLPDMILGSVKALKSKTMQEVIEFTTELMEDKTQAYAERQAERKRKYDDLSKNNQNQQNKRQNAGQAYTAGNSDRKPYAGIVGADLQMPTTATTTTITTTTTATTTTITRRAMVALSAELKATLKETAQD
ncbi:hypothetical protein Tco_1324507, partial [Tanacetum coccineum]